MKGYRFKLQKLLDIRMDKEEESKREFQKAQNESLKVKEKLDSLRENYNKYRNISSCQSVIDQKIKHIYLNTLNYSINETLQELDVKERIVEFKREELKQKQIDRKTVEILRDKERDLFVKEQNMIEQRMNDEFALYGFIRNIERR